MTDPLPSPNPYPLARLIGIGVLTVAAAVGANLVVYALLATVWSFPPEFPPLQLGSIAFLSALFVGLGVGVFILLTRWVKNPIKAFWIIGLIALVLSIVPNLIAAANPAAFPFPGGSTEAFLILIVFHGAAGAATIGLLTRFGRSG